MRDKLAHEIRANILMLRVVLPGDGKLLGAKTAGNP
jgi:hypothetical protein